MAQPGKPGPKLVQKAAQGNRKAFRELFNYHFQAVYNYALALAGDPALAEDITQETFIRAHKNLHRLGPPWNFHAWVFRLARNYFIDQIRKDRNLLPLEEDFQVISPRPGPEREKISQDTADRVHSTLGMLPVRQREILVLRELQGFSYGEIGEILDLSSANVKVSLHRARAAFAESYGIQLLLEDPSGDCLEIDELLPALHDGENLLDREKFIKQHLKVCEACQKRRDLLIKQSAIFGAFIPILPPQGLEERIFEKIPGQDSLGRPPKKTSISRALGIGGLSSIFGISLWLAVNMIFNTEGFLPNFPGKSGEQAIPTATAISESLPEYVGIPTPTAQPMNSYSGPVSPPARCGLFDGLEISTVFLNIRENNLTLPMYFKITGGVPGLGVEILDDEGTWEYNARLGGIESNSCSLQGYEERLYCLFQISEDMAGTYQELSLFLNGCEGAVYFASRVSIPELKLSVPACSRDLSSTLCEAAGGIYRQPMVIPSFCECP